MSPLLNLAASILAMIIDLAEDLGETITPEQVVEASKDYIAKNRERRAAAREANTVALEGRE